MGVFVPPAWGSAGDRLRCHPPRFVITVVSSLPTVPLRSPGVSARRPAEWQLLSGLSDTPDVLTRFKPIDWGR